MQRVISYCRLDYFTFTLTVILQEIVSLVSNSGLWAGIGVAACYRFLACVVSNPNFTSIKCHGQKCGF